jgi:CDP-paratose 2-epimerase
MHGFLAYLARAVKENRPYRIFGYKGKQVRDNIHAFDVCSFFEAFYRQPRVAAVYNIGGGRPNSISVIEAISSLEKLTGKHLSVEYREQHRAGDHICYISDLRRITSDYPSWRVTRNLDSILEELAGLQGVGPL